VVKSSSFMSFKVKFLLVA